MAAALEDVDALHDFEPVAGEAADGLAVAGDEGDGAGAGGFAGLDHEAGEEAGVVGVLHEGAGAGFDVEDEGVEALGELFAHDAGGDQVGAFDCRGVVAEGVENAVGGHEPGCLADERGSALAENLLEAGEGELGIEAGDGFELVECAAGVAEAAAGDHGDADAGYAVGGGCGEAGCGEDGRDQEGGFVAYAAGGVLVDGEGLEWSGVEGIAGEAHSLGEGCEFLGRQAALEDGHEEGRDLGFGDGLGFGIYQGSDEGLDLVGGEGFAIALAADCVLRVEAHALVTSARWKAPGSRSARVQVDVPPAVGKTRMAVGGANSAMVWRQAPQGWQALWLRLWMATARMRMVGPKRATAAAMAFCSAQVVRRKELFSTLQPETISPEPSRMAAPTKKRL